MGVGLNTVFNISSKKVLLFFYLSYSITLLLIIYTQKTMCITSPYSIWILVCCIPENINEEGYFDAGRNSVLGLDNMMTACKIEDGISKLFKL